MYLLDTNVVSELRKVRSGRADEKVVAWARQVSASQMFLSVISVLELETGILLVERRDAEQGAVLRMWLEEHVLPAFDGRILPIDVAIVRRCARLHVPNPKAERDALIVATALVHGMSVVTRNIMDFKDSGVSLLNPWETVAARK